MDRDARHVDRDHLPTASTDGPSHAENAVAFFHSTVNDQNYAREEKTQNESSALIDQD